MILLELFWSFFQIGLFSFGGGNAAMPFIQAQVVDLHGWLTLTEFADLVTLAEMTPGPIGVNAATFVGTRLGGVGGALIATAGCVLPLSLIHIYWAACRWAGNRPAQTNRGSPHGAARQQKPPRSDAAPAGKPK